VTFLERVLGGVVRSNNERIRAADPDRENPRDLRTVKWHVALVEACPGIQREWDRFAAEGGRLPLIEDLIVEHQGNEGPWRAGLLVSKGRPVEPLTSVFPATSAALSGIPGLRSALWSYMDPGTELPEHTGPNAGMLRYHLGVRCGDHAALKVDETVVPYRDGEGVLFDDTVPHAAWNRGSEPRVTLFCEIERPLPPVPALANRVVQRVISMDSRYRLAPRRAGEWHHALNGFRPS
jgi:ornithine lipid ester-linked acyl 2-hydroxylase